jgi:hypothetical protein
LWRMVCVVEMSIVRSAGFAGGSLILLLQTWCVHIRMV